MDANLANTKLFSRGMDRYNHDISPIFLSVLNNAKFLGTQSDMKPALSEAPRASSTLSGLLHSPLPTVLTPPLLSAPPGVHQTPHLADGFGAGLLCRLGQRALVEAGVGRPVPQLELLREVQNPRQLVLSVLGNCAVWDVRSGRISRHATSDNVWV